MAMATTLFYLTIASVWLALTLISHTFITLEQALLGWNLDRMEEAEKLLNEGIKANPKEWRLQQYLAALGYQKNHDLSKLTSNF